MKIYNLLDLFIAKEHPDFLTMDQEKQAIARSLLTPAQFKGRESYKHFAHLYGTLEGETFTVTINDSFTLRHYSRYNYLSKPIPPIHTCTTHIKRDELVGTKYVFPFFKKYNTKPTAPGADRGGLRWKPK